MLRMAGLTYRIGGRVLLDDASGVVGPGARVGLVGRNGAGKTTLLRLIAGEIEADAGEIEVPRRWRIGMTRQEAPADDRRLVDVVLQSDEELTRLEAEADSATDPKAIAAAHARLVEIQAHAAPARAARILAGLGFDEAAQNRPCREFSGGWRMRVALAALLFVEPDLLLLDEPTNHLDLEASLWLEDYLRRYPGTVVLVSHDRDLLNRVATQILHLENAKLTSYPGDYDRFERTRRERLELDAKLRVRQEAERARIQAFVDRFRYKASKARQAQSRIKMLERLEPIPEHAEEGTVSFAFPQPEQLAPPIANFQDAAVGYGGTPVLRRLDLRLDPDDRIALLGANGNGKSTFIRLLAGRLEPIAGRVARSSKLRVGYFAQHQAEELDLNATPAVELARRRPRDSETALRSHLGRFGFSQERADTRIANLSGGEKARLLFALMSVGAPQLLLLDEPTNHLDMASREALVQAINEFDGAVVIVSHDPHVVELVADRLWLVADGTVTPYDGDMESYRTLAVSRGRAAPESSPALADPKREQRRAAAERRKALAPLKKRIDAAEARVAKLEKERDALHEALARRYDAETQKRLGQLEKDLAAAEAEWTRLMEDYELASP
jgi:ATP-binding cassette subfamily F protein 3